MAELFIINLLVALVLALLVIGSYLSASEYDQLISGHILADIPEQYIAAFYLLALVVPLFGASLSLYIIYQLLIIYSFKYIEFVKYIHRNIT